MHKTLIVADDVSHFNDTSLTVLTFQDYLAEFPKLNEPKTRVINLCDTGKYLSQGYYCSLLAQARRHRVLPAVNTINDLRMTDTDEGAARLPLPDKFSWPTKPSEPTTFFVLFGETKDQNLSRIAQMAFRHFPCPILQVTLHVAAQDSAQRNSRQKDASIGFVECVARGFNDLPETLKADCIDRIVSFTQQEWRSDRKGKKMRWDMAILVNPDEPTPPSDSRAIKNFVKAAEKMGFNAEVVSHLTPEGVGHYDALFIRETTAIDHHTYRLARAAEREGLVVMDDTQSILRCCNKVFLQDAFAYQQVPAPQSQFVSQADDATCQQLIEELGLPLVLKLPESSFSRGVYKVENIEALKQRLDEMLQASALVLVQEYVFTEFDWRIGVLGGKPIYACQYFMARNHWQIYHHEGDRFSSGAFATMPTFEVPKPVLQAAIKSAKVVGNGLYGVDIKQSGNKVYVIEVNDNPSIDSGVEDKYLGKELYQLIMQEFANRLEQRGR
ncbi:RimK family protein [Alteromonas pelagimontana]|uniref:RimK family protein n=1 Tax=Alteromonas pelagimontana TaxID=1858656 RepID=A0A6M4MB76_9ALTE|nr:RimK family protein [Alteromonas pelagimontana]QJR79805.1 RimK family protein [Alteromonas pelagimontana]